MKKLQTELHSVQFLKINSRIVKHIRNRFRDSFIKFILQFSTEFHSQITFPLAMSHRPQYMYIILIWLWVILAIAYATIAMISFQYVKTKVLTPKPYPRSSKYYSFLIIWILHSIWILHVISFRWRVICVRRINVMIGSKSILSQLVKRSNYHCWTLSLSVFLC